MFAIFKIKNVQFVAKEGDLITVNFDIGDQEFVVKDTQYKTADEVHILPFPVKKVERVVSIKKRRRKSSMRKYGARNRITTAKIIKIVKNAKEAKA